MEFGNAVFPTGIRDIDQEILLRLNAESIDKTCTTNVYTSTLCDNLFWRRKFTRDYVDIGILDNYGELYHDISKINNYNDLLLYSTENGYLSLFKFALDKGADINYMVSRILSAASKQGHIDILKFVIENNEINQLEKDAILLDASEQGYLNIIEYILNNGADIDSTNNDFTSPLEEASKAGKIEAVKLLIDRGADIRLHACSALGIAASFGYLDIVKLFIESGINLQTDANSALADAAASGNLDIMKYLIEHGANVNGVPEAPIEYAINGGYVDAVKLLVDYGADIHINDDSVFTMAESTDMMEYLLDNYDFDLDKLLLRSTGSKNTILIKLLLKHGANVHVDGDMPLLNAITIKNNKTIIELLIKYGADVNARDGDPLIYLSRTKRLENAKLLLNNGACLNLERFSRGVDVAKITPVQKYLQSKLSKNNICILNAKKEDNKLCLGITKKGVQCKNKPMHGSVYCRVHQK